MVTGWKKAFYCTSEKQQQQKQQQHDWDCDNMNRSPNLTFHSDSSPTPNSLPNSPTSTFSFFKSTLRLSKNRCGVCAQSVKAGQGTAIFTAECSHTFHFPCIATHVTTQHHLTCPVCAASWKQLIIADENSPPPNDNHTKTTASSSFKLYNDDEPLASPTSVSGFNPIPESEEELEQEENEEFRGFHVSPSSPSKSRETVEASFLPEAAIVASNRSYETYVAVLKVMAPPCDAAAPRPSVDLVVVLDISGNVSGEELRMMKRSMRVVISTLGSTDRLSVIVAFSGGSKRLFPLRRMTAKGQRSARRLVDALANFDRYRGGIPARSDALKKAAKVLEERREKNPVAKILLLSNGQDDQRLSSTSFSHLEIPVRGGSCGQDGAFAKRVACFLSVAAQDLTLELIIASRSAAAEIAAVYSLSPEVLSPDSAAIGDLYAAEERKLLVELKVPARTMARGSHRHVISVRSSHRDPLSRELVHSKERVITVPRPQAVGSQDTKIKRLRNLHVVTRAVAESRRLSAHNDVAGAISLLSSARALLMQPSQEADCAGEYLQWIDSENAELRHRMQSQKSPANNCLEKKPKPEPFTPTSAWRVAERLAKVAMMRRSVNRVSDLHGFENAGF